MEIDADESRLAIVAPRSGGGQFGLGFGFRSSFDRAHGDKLHEAHFPGVGRVCLEHVKAAGGPSRHLPLRARSSTGLAVRALRYDGGLLRPISIIERPLDDRPLGKALFWLGKKPANGDRLTQIRSDKTSATASGIIEKRADKSPRDQTNATKESRSRAPHQACLRRIQFSHVHISGCQRPLRSRCITIRHSS